MIPGLAIGKIAGMIGVKGFIAIGLGLALAIVMWRADVLSGKLDDARQTIANERAAHAITRASVETLTSTIETLNAEANARAEAFEKSRTEARREAEALERAAVRSDAQIASLRALAANGGQCEVPGELEGLLDGL